MRSAPSSGVGLSQEKRALCAERSVLGLQALRRALACSAAGQLRGPSAGRRALLACLGQAQASSQGGQGSLPPSPRGTACAEREQAAGVPARVEEPAAQRQPAETRSLGGNSASSLHGSGQQQHGAPANSRLECARGVPAPQGQPQRGRAPGPSQPGSESQAASALADLRLDSAPRKRLPTSRSLCYGEGPAVLDERCTGRDARSSPADERCGGRVSSPADERCDGRASSPAGEGSGRDGSGAGRARADARCSASKAGPGIAPEDPCSGREPNQRAWRLEDAQALVVYGLGSLEGGPAPRYQLALALLLAARMPALRPPIQVRPIKLSRGMQTPCQSP